MTTTQQQFVRGPVLNSPHRLKLGTFGTNVEGGPTLTRIPTRLRARWEDSVAVAQLADGLGLDAIVPVARWRGHGGAHNTHGVSFDTFAWAAGIAAVTERAQIFTTCHMPTIHPIVAAKQLATIDHISGGRAAINTVGGWFRDEMEMFGTTMLEHDRRYDLADEWTDILLRLWTEYDEFDVDGAFFRIRRGHSEPKPLQTPRPPVMNAGGSARGRRYAAQHADMAFVVLHGDDPEQHRQQVAEIKDLARDEFGREIQVWTNAYLVCRESRDEAERFVRWYVDEHGDLEAATNALATMSLESEVLGEQVWQEMRRGFIAGSGGVALVGTPDDIANRLEEMSQAGVDGCLLVCAEWTNELSVLGAEVLPLLERRGLRSGLPT